ncbi:alcohol acyl transferase 1 allele RGa-like [Andrographis paniculata]|uniref:alcohol acyl transferase 1 allele RGa-like n=1 Tax=Andrographis paniculata TaxID=175694 RepID=UPI0021E78DB9|nr:alcohol acyl transferase 1 allele RGa-like [Andrographis paniculata]
MALSKDLIFNLTKKEPEIVSAKIKTPTSKNHEIKCLSDIDDQDGLRYLQPLIFFYPPSSSTIDPVVTIRHGLPKALEAYYPLAGRVFEGPNGKLMVYCNNEGVVFVEARGASGLDGLRHHSYLRQSFFVTRFTCGFSLGFLFNHTLLDGSGLWLFLNAIGELAKGASKLSVDPVWRRELLEARSPPRITCHHYEYDHKISSDKPLVYPKDTFILTLIFFSPIEIQTLYNQLPKAQFSSFHVIIACLWKCRTIALEAHPDDIVRVFMLVNMRYGTSRASIPQGYYGNVFACPAAISKASTLCESPLEHIANLIRKAKCEMNEDYIKSVADLMVIKGRPKFADTWSLGVSDLRKIGFDNLDVGFGEPSFAGVPWATSDFTFYNNVKCDGGEDGVLVTICLPSMAIEKFQSELKKMTREPISVYILKY